VFKTYLHIGSNKGNKLQNLEYCILLINQLAGKVLKKSGVYKTEPWGYIDPEYYLNQVLLCSTVHPPKDLLIILHKIEIELGRTRSGKRYEARTMDIDILLYESLVIKSPFIELPHPRMHLRKFVLEPMVEIAPDQLHPQLLKPMKYLLDICADNSFVKRIAREKNVYER